MRVGLDLTCWSNRRGYGRFARGLVNGVVARGGGHEYVLLLDSQSAKSAELPAVERVILPTRTAPTEAASAGGRRSIADLWAMSSTVSKQRLDVLFYPTVYTWFPVRTSATVILGIHDVIAEDYPQQVFPRRYRRLLWSTKSWLARRRADYLMTVSEHARRGILRRFRYPEERVWVVGEAADPLFEPLGDEAAAPDLLGRVGLAEGQPYLIYLGGFNPHKNLGRLLCALRRVREDAEAADLGLILVGDLQDAFTPGLESVRAGIAELGLEDAVFFTGYLPDEEVRHLLSLSRALVLPSLAEGFGLPAVEAAACGTPVIATSNSPLPELLAGGGLFCDPEDSAALEGAIRRLITDHELRRQLGATALRRAGELSWSRSADQFEELLDVIARRRR